MAGLGNSVKNISKMDGGLFRLPVLSMALHRFHILIYGFHMFNQRKVQDILVESPH